MAHSPRDDANQESQGTGEQYVKTTGLAADGGNFDATKPGAGREADRKFTHPQQNDCDLANQLIFTLMKA